MLTESSHVDATNAYLWTNGVLQSLREALGEMSFVEMLPAILSTRYEPGARHSVAIMGKQRLPEIHRGADESAYDNVTVKGHRCYYLPVSHAVEKQMALEHLERVYCIAPCVRLLMQGEHTSGQHLYTFFQVEIEWRTESIQDVFQTAEALLAKFANNLARRLSAREALASRSVERAGILARIPYPRVTFKDALKRVRNGTSTEEPVNPHSAGDFTGEEECRLASSYDTPFWLYDYPEGVRDSIYRRNSSGTYDTYDLMLPFGYGELFTGGLRPESGEEVVRQSKLLGKEFHPDYAAWKDRTGVQTGGFGIGLERLVRFCSLMPSILDLRRYHDSGPNAMIEFEHF